MSLALQGRSACILEHHGTIAFADNLAKAYDKVRQLEWLCDVWLRAQTAGRPAELTEEELTLCINKFAAYGQPATLL
jgi:L-fuculose-phosphate aldolase